MSLLTLQRLENKTLGALGGAVSKNCNFRIYIFPFRLLKYKYKIQKDVYNFF